MKYEVQLETSVTVQVQIEADNPEEAVRLAHEQYGKQTKQLSLYPTWVEESEKLEASGELSMKLETRCDRCGKFIVMRDIPGQPWNYTCLDEHMYEVACYSCAQSPLKQLADVAE